MNAGWGFPVQMSRYIKWIYNPNTKYRRMEHVIRWQEKAILSFWGVNPCGLRFGMCPPGEEGAWPHCDVQFLFFKQVVLPAWPCLKTTLQWCLLGLSEPGDSSDFLAWLFCWFILEYVGSFFAKLQWDMKYVSLVRAITLLWLLWVAGHRLIHVHCEGWGGCMWVVGDFWHLLFTFEVSPLWFQVQK